MGTFLEKTVTTCLLVVTAVLTIGTGLYIVTYVEVNQSYNMDNYGYLLFSFIAVFLFFALLAVIFSIMEHQVTPEKRKKEEELADNFRKSQIRTPDYGKTLEINHTS